MKKLLLTALCLLIVKAQASQKPVNRVDNKHTQEIRTPYPSASSASASSGSASSSSGIYPTPNAHLSEAGCNSFSPDADTQYAPLKRKRLNAIDSCDSSQRVGSAQTANEDGHHALDGVPSQEKKRKIEPLVPSNTASAASSSSFNAAYGDSAAEKSNRHNTGLTIRALKKPIVGYPGSLAEKNVLFNNALAKKEDEKIYHMLYDPAFQELYAAHKTNGDLIYRLLQEAIANDDIAYVKAFVIDYIKCESNREGAKEQETQEDIQRLVHDAANKQDVEMMLALLTRNDKTTCSEQQQLLHEYYLMRYDKAWDRAEIIFDSYKKAHALIAQRSKEEALFVYRALESSTQMPLALCVLTTQMFHPDQSVKTIGAISTAYTVMHEDLGSAISKGDLKRFDALAQAGWITNNRSSSLCQLAQAQEITACEQSTQLQKSNAQKTITAYQSWTLYQAFVLAAQHNQEEILNRLIELTPFVLLRQIENDIPEVASRTSWIDKKKKWVAEKNKELIDSLDDADSIGFIRALDHGADPNVMVDMSDNAHKPHKAPAIFSSLRLPEIYQKALIVYGANLHATMVNEEGITTSLLQEAVNQDIAEAEKDFISSRIKLLIEAGIGQNIFSSDTILAAVFEDSTALLQSLAKETAELAQKKKNLFATYAATANRYNHLKLLFEAGAHPNSTNNYGFSSALECALDQKDTQALQIVLDTKRVNAKKLPKIAIGFLIHRDKFDHLKMLLDSFLDPNTVYSDGSLIARDTLSKKDTRALQLFADTKKLNVNLLLKHALDKPDHLKILLEAGADPKEPLLRPDILALQKSNPVCFKMLVEHGFKA
jgi:hypothetical protein